jgi:hypothetical protein
MCSIESADGRFWPSERVWFRVVMLPVPAVRVNQCAVLVSRAKGKCLLGTSGPGSPVELFPTRGTYLA